VEFERTAADGDVPNNADGQYLSPIATLTTELTREEAALVGQGQQGSGNSAPVSVELFPLMYDLNDDGLVGFPDFSHFAAVFLQQVGQSDASFASDFDRSGKVDFSDFAFFAANFGQNSTSRVSRTYAPNFPDDWLLSLNVLAATMPASDAAKLSDHDLTGVVDAAVARLASRLDQDVVAATLSDVTFEFVDLPGKTVGLADESAGLVQIDFNAAGHGWFVDATPMSDDEFAFVASAYVRAATEDGPAFARVDLLTVLMHELGHLLGFDDDDGHSLMESTISPGTRRLADFGRELTSEPWDGAALDRVFADLE
jgi:hypothetical protein